MAIERHVSASPSARSRPRGLLAGGTAGNERLTATTGGVLILLLAVIGVTIIRIGPLLSVHLFVGMMLIGPVVLKLASTGYRFVRYYAGNLRYRSKGPPALPLRLLAPLVVLSTVVVFASGIALLFAGPSSRDTLLPIHKISFFVWVAVTALHVVAHLPAVLHALSSDYGRSAHATDAITGHSGVSGRAGRSLSLAGALTLGVVIAILVIPEFGPWLTHNLHHH
jgi:hypothetical protein